MVAASEGFLVSSQFERVNVCSVFRCGFGSDGWIATGHCRHLRLEMNLVTRTKSLRRSHRPSSSPRQTRPPAATQTRCSKPTLSLVRTLWRCKFNHRMHSILRVNLRQSTIQSTAVGLYTRAMHSSITCTGAYRHVQDH